ncbi:unnamed protein product, partial [Amoebophrya sp. A120]
QRPNAELRKLAVLWKVTMEAEEAEAKAATAATPWGGLSIEAFKKHTAASVSRMYQAETGLRPE